MITKTISEVTKTSKDIERETPNMDDFMKLTAILHLGVCNGKLNLNSAQYIYRQAMNMFYGQHKN